MYDFSSYILILLLQYMAYNNKWFICLKFQSEFKIFQFELIFFFKSKFKIFQSEFKKFNLSLKYDRGLKKHRSGFKNINRGLKY